jgi:hypothetical protein
LSCRRSIIYLRQRILQVDVHTFPIPFQQFHIHRTRQCILLRRKGNIHKTYFRQVLEDNVPTLHD